MVFLPCELINEILLKLPLKCVIRFKCVCKSWYTLISDPYFAMLRSKRVTPSPQERILYFNGSNDEFRSMECNASLYDDSVHFILNCNFLPPKPVIVSILGSCRGFLHLRSYEVAGSFVWNPFTGIHKHIPMSPNQTDWKGEFFIPYFYGFGYDPSTDDYLVVQIAGNSRRTRVDIFSLRTNAWKEIEAPILTSKPCSSGEEKGWYLNGALDWMTFKDSASMNVILVFDLTEMSFSEIPFLVDFEYQTYALTLLDENLCAVVLKGYSIEIWMMKEYKVELSWTKRIVLSLDGTSIRNFFPICSTESGNIVGTYSSGLAIFNDKGQLIEHRSYRFLSVGAVYRESLFSLPCDRNEMTNNSQ